MCSTEGHTEDISNLLITSSENKQIIEGEGFDKVDSIVDSRLAQHYLITYE